MFSFQTPQGKQVQEIMRNRNVNKEIRLIQNTTGHEQSVHIERFKKLIKRYGMKEYDALMKGK